MKNFYKYFYIYVGAMLVLVFFFGGDEENIDSKEEVLNVEQVKEKEPVDFAEILDKKWQCQSTNNKKNHNVYVFRDSTGHISSPQNNIQSFIIYKKVYHKESKISAQFAYILANGVEVKSDQELSWFFKSVSKDSLTFTEEGYRKDGSVLTNYFKCSI